MNSVYKKIALVCVLSVAANQAALAIQVPSFWNWMKVNQKTTAAIVAGFAAVIAAILMQQNKKAQKKSFNDNTKIYISGENLDVSVSDRLDALTHAAEGSIAALLKNHKNCNVVTVANEGKHDNPLACVVVQEHANRIEISHMGIDKGRWITALLRGLTQPDIEKELLKLTIQTQTRKNIEMGRDVSDADVDCVRQQIKAYDGIEPMYEGRVFRRDAARAKFVVKIGAPKAAVDPKEIEQRSIWEAGRLAADRARVHAYLGEAMFTETDRDKKLAAQLEQTQKLKAKEASATSSPAVSATA